MSRHETIEHAEHLRRFVRGSLTTMNLITMFWFACRDTGLPVAQMDGGGRQRSGGQGSGGSSGRSGK